MHGVGRACGPHGGAGTCSTIRAEDSGTRCTLANGKCRVLKRNVAVLRHVPSTGNHPSSKKQRRENWRDVAVAALGREGAPVVLPLFPSLSCPFTSVIAQVQCQCR